MRKGSDNAAFFSANSTQKPKFFGISEEGKTAELNYKLYTTLLNKWYIDELYDALFVHRAKDLGRGLWRFDGKIVDGIVNNTALGTKESASGSSWWDRWIVDGLVRFAGGFVKILSWPVRLSETGYTQNYALVMIFGVLVLVGYVLWGTS